MNEELEKRFIDEDPECDILEGRYKPKTIMDRMSEIQGQTNELISLAQENQRLASKFVFNPNWLIK